MTTYRTKDGQEYELYTKFSHYQSPYITWIPLLVSENRVKYFDQSQLVEVVSPFETGMLYGCELPPRSIVLWRPTMYLSPDQLWSKGESGVKLVECRNVNVVIQLEAA